MQRLIFGEVFEDGFSVASVRSGQLLLDTDGNNVFPIVMQQIGKPSEGMVVVSQDKAMKLVDRTGNVVFTDHFSLIRPVPGTLVLQFYRQGQMSYLNTKGKWLNFANTP